MQCFVCATLWWTFLRMLAVPLDFSLEKRLSFQIGRCGPGIRTHNNRFAPRPFWTYRPLMSLVV